MIFCVSANSKTVGLSDQGTFARAVAAEYQVTDHFNVFVSVGYDTDHLFNVRPGFNIQF